MSLILSLSVNSDSDSDSDSESGLSSAHCQPFTQCAVAAFNDAELTHQLLRHGKLLFLSQARFLIQGSLEYRSEKPLPCKLGKTLTCDLAEQLLRNSAGQG